MAGTTTRAGTPTDTSEGGCAGPPYGDSSLDRLYEYWRSKHRDGKLPARADIDPLDIPEILAFVFLVDVQRSADGPRFRYRLLGTMLVEYMGVDATGQLVGEAFPKRQTAEINAAYASVVATGEPHCWDYAVPMPDREHVRYRRLMCPLASDGATIDALIGVLSYRTG